MTTITTRRSLDQQHSIVQAAHDYGVILDTREIFLYGHVDEDGEFGNRFITNIRILLSKSSSSPIVIHQHNLGGDWSCGMMIFDCIKSCPCPIAFICHGMVASMGTVIPMACIGRDDYIISMPNCDWMIHDGSTGIQSGLTMKQAKSWAAWEARTAKTMRELYVEACAYGSKFEGKNKSQIRARIKSKLDSDEDWYLSAQEAVEYGFAHAIFGDKGFESIENIKKHWQ